MYKKLTPILMLFLLLFTNQIAQTTVYSTFGPGDSWDVDNETDIASLRVGFHFTVGNPGYTNITIEAVVYDFSNGSCSIEVYNDDGSNLPTGSPLASGTMPVTTSEEIQSTNFSNLNLTPGIYHVVFSGDVYYKWNNQSYIGASASNDGIVWFPFPAAPQAAFRVTGGSALPVELTSFEGFATEDGVLLRWETATEVNNYGFEILRSAQNDTTWNNIGFVEGHGNSNSPKEYSFGDSSPMSGTVQYRLKQIDTDGKFEYSEIVEIEIEGNLPKEFTLYQNYPNPFNPSTTIKFIIPVVGGENFHSLNTQLIVYDILGREVATLVNTNLKPGNYEVNFDAKNLSGGVYFYRIKAGNEYQSVKKMLLLK